MLFENNDSCIIINEDILDETYIPADIPSRSKQINELTFCLDPATKNRKPMHAWIYGEPGVGKTLTANYMLKELEKAYVDSIYVNCWSNSTLYSIMDTLIRNRMKKDIRLFRANEHSTSIKLDRFRQHIKKESFIIILDEIDSIPSKERNRVIYNLCTIGKAGLVCIGNSKSVYYGLDSRVRSRLDAKLIEFKPYSAVDLTGILKQRVMLALAPDTWSKRILEKIAGLSEGDARVAIRTLKNSAEYAEKDASAKITSRHVRKGYDSAKNLKKSYRLYKLSQHYRILYNLIKNSPDVLSTDLWKSYLKKCRGTKLKPIAKRTYFAQIKKLMKIGLVRGEWVDDSGVSWGRMRSFRVM